MRPRSPKSLNLITSRTLALIHYHHFMSKYEYDLIIIGGGSAGLSLASGASQLGVKVLLLSKEQLGGDCLHYGCVPSKSLLKSAKVANVVKKSDDFGIRSASPKTDWLKVQSRIQGVQDVIQHHDNPDRFREYGCDVIFGEAQFVNDHSVSVQLTEDLQQLQQPEFLMPGHSLKFSGKKIVIATGSRPNIVPIKGLDTVPYITNETIFTLPNQPESLLIIGGGVIGIEMGQAMQRLGTKVTIGIREHNILTTEDKDVAEVIEQSLLDDGVELLRGIEFSEIKKSSSGITLMYKQDGTKKEQNFSAVLVATGRKANVELNLEAAGVKYDRVIAVNAKMRTNKKHILAIGDVNGKAQFTHAANYEAGIVLSNEILHVPSKANYSSIGWTLFTEPELASIGLNEKTAKKNKIKHTVIKSTFKAQDRALTESATSGFIKILLDKKGKILGCQIINPRAGEMIREWQLAMAQNISLSKIARSTFIYPTFGEISKWAPGSHLAKSLFSNKVRKLLRLVFRYRGKVEQ